MQLCPAERWQGTKPALRINGRKKSFGKYSIGQLVFNNKANWAGCSPIRNSEKRNSRVGEGELSIWVAVKALKDLFECAVMSIDSDVKALMKSFAEEG